MPFDVFISHSLKDKAVADAVCARLEAAKVRCWIAPRDISPGADWAESIIDALGSCHVMILIFSSHSNVSPQVKREVQRAFEKGLTVMPFRIEDVQPSASLEYYIGSVHWLDALNEPVERHIDKLVILVKAFIEAASAKLAAPPGPTVTEEVPPAMEERERVSVHEPDPQPVHAAAPVVIPSVVPMKMVGEKAAVTVEQSQPVIDHGGGMDAAKKLVEKFGKGRLMIAGAALIVVLGVAGWWFGHEGPALDAKRLQEQQQADAAAKKKAADMQKELDTAKASAAEAEKARLAAEAQAKATGQLSTEQQAVNDYMAGLPYCFGAVQGVMINYDRAMAFFQQAADQHLPEAEARMGGLYFSGLGATKDAAKAQEWGKKESADGLEARAQAGKVRAEAELGVLYDLGVGVSKSSTKAAKWYQKAADAGDADAQYNLGVLYADGIGVDKSSTKAAMWYQKAADQGYAFAQNDLGVLYAKGQGVDKDFKKAVELYQKASDP